MPGKKRTRVRRKTNKKNNKRFNLKGFFNFLRTRKKRTNKRKKQSGG